jgi:uncharacterized protein YhdP
MPVANETAATTVAQRSRAARLMGFAGTLLAGLVIVACATMLAVRYVVLPQVSSYRAEIAERLSREIGAPVAIEGIGTGWDGWNPQIVVTGLSIRDSANADARAVLTLPRVEATISWLSLVVADLRLRQLEIDRPELTVTRLPNGHLRVAGFEFDPEASGGDSRMGDWILRQREIVIHDALLTWHDQRRNAPQLLLDRVQFRLEHPLGSRRHRFGLTGAPPAEVAAPIDLRGEFVNATAQDWSAAEGRMYLRMDYADIAAWSEWLPLPIEVDDGRGAVRLWLEYQAGVMRDLTADLELVDVRTRIERALPWLELARVSGRVTWHATTRRSASRPTTSRWCAARARSSRRWTSRSRRRSRRTGATAAGRASADTVELAPIAMLAASLPMPAKLREDLAQYAPRGTLRNARYRWEGPADKPVSYAGEAEAIDVGIAPVGAGPASPRSPRRCRPTSAAAARRSAAGRRRCRCRACSPRRSRSTR